MSLNRMLSCFALVASIATLVGCGGGGSGSGSNVTRGASTITGRAVNSNGQPASGAKVALLQAGSQSRAAIETTTTDVSGNFTLTDVAAGTYTVSISETLPSGAVDTVLVTVTVSAATTITLTVDMSSTVTPGIQTGSVFGTVTDDSGVPVVGATVMLHSQSDSSLPVLKTTTDTTGAFNFSTVTTGLWTVSVQGKHISSTARMLADVQAGAASQVDLTVALGGNGGHD